MKREKRQGLFVLLFALGLIFVSVILLYCAWRDPNVAVAIGMLWAAGAAAFWIYDALMLRFAPGRVVQRRIDKAIQGKWNSYLCPYDGSGQLLEEYRREQQDQEEEEGDGIFPCLVILTGREKRQRLTLSVKEKDVQQLELKEGDRVLLILSGLIQGVFLLGTLDRITEDGKNYKAGVTLWKGLICDREREVFL